MSHLLVLASPIVVSLVASFIKKIPLFASLVEGKRKTILRIGVLVISFIGAIGTAWVTGAQVDPVSIQTFTDTLLTFLGASGVYMLAKPQA